MDLADHTTAPPVALFWSQYIDVLSLFRIPDKTRQWYWLHIKAFIDGHPNTRLKEHSITSVDA
ncbi:MAG: hypothetical protein ABW158_08610 [Candidatus Thiodiazotropha sp. 6PDIVS]